MAFSNLHEMVSSAKVDFGEERRIVEVRKKVRHGRNRVRILAGYCVETSVIHAKSKSSVLLGNKKYAGSYRRFAWAYETLLYML